jgi:hypothetical protein
MADVKISDLLGLDFGDLLDLGVDVLVLLSCDGQFQLREGSE